MGSFLTFVIAGLIPSPLRHVGGFVLAVGIPGGGEKQVAVGSLGNCDSSVNSCFHGRLKLL